jgi:hypothetical protein
MFHLYGGHRLWCAPEAFPETSFPDDHPVQIDELSDGVRLQAPPEAISGITKSLEIHLDPDCPALTVIHRLQNEGDQARELAPWGITELPLGGTALLPERTDTEGLGPNRQFVLWPYTHWKDARMDLRDDCIRIFAKPPTGTNLTPPLKIGYFDGCGWVAYLRKDVLFVKRFQTVPEGRYPDLNCNVEIYVNAKYMELETLAPLTCLEPGQAVTYQERWQLYPHVPDWREVQALLN